MIRRLGLWGRWHTAAATIGFAVITGLAPLNAADVDPSNMSVDEIKALEQRLTNAGCYKGAIDGQTSGAFQQAIKACPDQQPFLQIETGMHIAPIARIGVDEGCSVLATASDDKTVRLWSLPQGHLKRVVRLPIGEGDAGEASAVALSPDGHLLAVGSTEAPPGKTRRFSLVVVDLSSGAIQRFGAASDNIHHLAFSPDGRRLAVGDEKGYRVLDPLTGAELLVDHASLGAVGPAFTRDGALIVVTADGQLRRYGADLKLVRQRRIPTDAEWGPGDMAVDPAGRRVAVASLSGVAIADAATLKPLRDAQTGDLNAAEFSAVAWSRDSATLVVSGYKQLQSERQSFLLRLDSDGRRRGPSIDMGNRAVTDVQSCGEGFAFSTGEPAFGLISAQGTTTILQGRRAADMQGKLGAAFSISADANSVRFGLGFGGEKPVVFDLTTASLVDSPSPLPGFMRPQVVGLPVKDWESNPTFKQKTIDLESFETSHALAIRPGRSGFVLGTDWGVRAYDARGNEHWPRHRGPGIAWGVHFSADGQIVVAAFNDGTIRWLRWKDGVELLALFVEPQTRKWLAWTPSGYYIASAGGEDIIGWRVNRGWTQEADFFPASQFRAEYNRPDIVRLVLKTLDEAEAVHRADQNAQHVAPAKAIATALPPVVTITSPANGSQFSGDSVDITYSLRSPSGLPIDRLDVLADGQPARAEGFLPPNPAKSPGVITAAVPRKNVAVSLIAHSGELTSAPVSVTLEYGTPIIQESAVDLRPKLYGLLIGVTGYEKPGYDDLKYPAHDAAGLAEALKKQKGGLYADVETKLVDVPSRDSVLDGLNWLAHAATTRDLSIVYLSGHGVRDSRLNFWFLPREADYEQLQKTAISDSDLLDLVLSVAGKKLLFIDACHAGSVRVPGFRDPLEAKPEMNKVVNEFSAAGSGLVVYGASTGGELALEDEKWDRHSAFAKALIEAVSEGKAKGGKGGVITTDMLGLYLDERVKELTTGEQHPVMNRSGLIPDFPILLARP